MPLPCEQMSIQFSYTLDTVYSLASQQLPQRLYRLYRFIGDFIGNSHVTAVGSAKVVLENIYKERNYILI